MPSFQDYLVYLAERANDVRLKTVTMLTQAESGHLGGALSTVEILVAIYYGQIPGGGPIMNFDVAKPGWDGQDYFVLSKAHAAPSLYAILAQLNFIDEQELRHFRQMNGILQAYPVKKIPGISICTGFPGHGLAASVGLAMQLKSERASNRVFCLVGDGELQEGLIWESALVAAQYKLDNLTLVIDVNEQQGDGMVRSILQVDPITDKFQSFGWKIIPVRDGHDFEELLFAYERALDNLRKPSVIIAKTVKGKGIPFVENKISYHAEVLSQQEYQEALSYLKVN